MVQISQNRLNGLAFRVLEEAASEALIQPVRRTIGVRLALAYLASRQECERWPFDGFWEALPIARDHDRAGSIIASLNAIYLQVGIARCGKLAAQCERDVKARLSDD